MIPTRTFHWNGFCWPTPYPKCPPRTLQANQWIPPSTYSNKQHVGTETHIAHRVLMISLHSNLHQFSSPRHGLPFSQFLTSILPDPLWSLWSQQGMRRATSRCCRPSPRSWSSASSKATRSSWPRWIPCCGRCCRWPKRWDPCTAWTPPRRKRRVFSQRAERGRCGWFHGDIGCDRGKQLTEMGDMGRKTWQKPPVVCHFKWFVVTLRQILKSWGFLWGLVD